MDVNHKHEVGQSAKGGFGAAFGSVFGKFFGCVGVLLVILVLIGMLSMCSGSNKGKGPSSGGSNSNAPVVEVSAQDLSKAFQTNEAKAKLEYDGKQLKVTGTVKDIDLDFADNPVIRLKGSGDQYGMGVNSDGKMTDVAVNGLAKEAAAAINKGQKLSVVCGGVNEVMGGPQLSDCSIAK
jgi:tRNA_anti-like